MRQQVSTMHITLNHATPSLCQGDGNVMDHHLLPLLGWSETIDAYHPDEQALHAT